jgi:transcriptional regulator with XRE-family HTH domain
MRALALDSAVRLGAAVRAERERTGQSQTALAQKAGVTRQWLVLLESGRLVNPTLAPILRTLAALGLQLQVSKSTGGDVDLDALLGGS